MDNLYAITLLLMIINKCKINDFTTFSPSIFSKYARTMSIYSLTFYQQSEAFLYYQLIYCNNLLHHCLPYSQPPHGYVIIFVFQSFYSLSFFFRFNIVISHKLTTYFTTAILYILPITLINVFLSRRPLDDSFRFIQPVSCLPRSHRPKKDPFLLFHHLFVYY